MFWCSASFTGGRYLDNARLSQNEKTQALGPRCDVSRNAKGRYRGPFHLRFASTREPGAGTAPAMLRSTLALWACGANLKRPVVLRPAISYPPNFQELFATLYPYIASYFRPFVV